MTQVRFLIPVIVVAAAMAPGPARAGGWGPYVSWSHDMPKTGFPDWVIEAVSPSLDPVLRPVIESAMRGTELKFEQDHVSFGVIYDSAPSRDKLFNFRMTLGADFAVKGSITDLTFPGTGIPFVDDYVGSAAGYLDTLLDTTGYGGTLQFTFGFAPIRHEILKWWLGPTVRFNGNYHTADIPVSYGPIPVGRLKHGGTVALGGGVETGLNFHVSSFLSIGLTGGFLWNAYGLGAALEDSSGEISSGTMVWGDGPMFLLQFSALFHTGGDSGAWH